MNECPAVPFLLKLLPFFLSDAAVITVSFLLRARPCSRNNSGYGGVIVQLRACGDEKKSQIVPIHLLTAGGVFCWERDARGRNCAKIQFFVFPPPAM